MNSLSSSMLLSFKTHMDQVEPSSPTAHFLACIPLVNHLFIEMKFRQLTRELNESVSWVDQAKVEAARLSENDLIKNLAIRNLGGHPEVQSYIQSFKRLSDFSSTCQLVFAIVKITTLAVLILTLFLAPLFTPFACFLGYCFFLGLHAFSIKERLSDIEFEQNRKFFYNKELVKEMDGAN